jgi:hypothetical protein
MSRVSIAIFTCCLIGATSAQSAPRRATDAPEPVAGNPDKMVCKRFVRIGSLVDSYRTCKTKGEWQRERDNLRQSSLSDSCGRRGETGGGVNPVPGGGNTFDC